MDLSLDLVTVRDFAIALFIGALIGIEREKRQSAETWQGIGGIRTFTLLAETGAVSAWLSQRLGSPWIFVATLAGVAAVVTAGYVTHTRHDPEAQGLTTEVAAIATVLLGGATLWGFAGIAVMLAIATSAVLAFKEPIHGLVERVGVSDLYAGLKLLFATFIVLPLLPNQALDRWGAFNPYEAWWLVILIASISLAGYVTVRWLGPARGTAVTGLFGGLVSSTAVTLAFARRSRERDGLDAALAAGILFAWAVMFVRITVEVVVVHPPLVGRVAWPALTVAVTAAALATHQLWRQRRGRTGVGPQDVPLSNPFSLTSAIKFAALFSVVLLAVALAREYTPDGGLLVVAGISGLTDVDAITLSLARYVRDGGESGTAVAGIAIAALANTLVKAGLVAGLGGAALRSRIVVATSVMIVVGGAVLLLG